MSVKFQVLQNNRYRSNKITFRNIIFFLLLNINRYQNQKSKTPKGEPYLNPYNLLNHKIKLNNHKPSKIEIKSIYNPNDEHYKLNQY